MSSTGAYSGISSNGREAGDESFISTLCGTKPRSRLATLANQAYSKQQSSTDDHATECSSQTHPRPRHVMYIITTGAPAWPLLSLSTLHRRNRLRFLRGQSWLSGQIEELYTRRAVPADNLDQLYIKTSETEYVVLSIFFKKNLWPCHEKKSEMFCNNVSIYFYSPQWKITF